MNHTWQEGIGVLDVPVVVSKDELSEVLDLDFSLRYLDDSQQ